MNIITKKRATRIRFRFLLISFLTVALIAFLLLTDYVLQREVPIAVIIMGAIIYIYYIVKKYMYFSFNDETEKIIVRYFKLVPSTLEHHSIEMPKTSLVKFEMKKSIFNLREELILTQKTKNGIAKYPPISITILNSAERSVLIESLNKIINSIKK